MKKSNLSEEMIREGDASSGEELEARVGQIHELVRREKSRLRQMKWVTATLWMLTFVFFGLLGMGKPGKLFDSHPLVAIIGAYLAVTLLPLSIISTVLLGVRRQGSSGKETNLRLMILEERLRDLEKNRRLD